MMATRVLMRMRRVRLSSIPLGVDKTVKFSSIPLAGERGGSIKKQEKKEKIRGLKFDPSVPSLLPCGGARPIRNPAKSDIEIAKFAVSEHNKKTKDKGGQLDFVRFVEGKVALVAGLSYYITLEAKNRTTGQVFRYMTMVYHYNIGPFAAQPRNTLEFFERGN